MAAEEFFFDAKGEGAERRPFSGLDCRKTAFDIGAVLGRDAGIMRE
jgi:hypothetical protein